jgi:penicillin amidase
VIDDYLSATDNLTFEDVRDLALNIATTDSFGSGGVPWDFVYDRFSTAVINAGLTPERQAALNLLAVWDGHFVNGGPSQWRLGSDRADAWVLQDVWTREVNRLTFADELGTGTYYNQVGMNRMFNVVLHGLAGSSSGIVNTYKWFQNLIDPSAPKTPDEIIVKALDNVLVTLGNRPWGTNKRGSIVYRHDLIGQVWAGPFSSRSTYAHCVELGNKGPIRIESMFPLGESGNILPGPVFDTNFFSMTPMFDPFAPRPFPLFN